MCILLCCEFYTPGKVILGNLLLLHLVVTFYYHDFGHRLAAIF